MIKRRKTAVKEKTPRRLPRPPRALPAKKGGVRERRMGVRDASKQNLAEKADASKLKS
jgi:hypothetical protein